MDAMVKTNGVSMKLDMATVRLYICPKASDKEIFMFLQTCQIQQLNPFLKEIYLIKIGGYPAQNIIGIETFRKRASRHPNYRGHTTVSNGEQPELTATTEVFVAGYKVPISCTVEYAEYVGRKQDGQPNKFWFEKPKTMLKKVSEAQALRTAFPEAFGGLYSVEEINYIPPDKVGNDKPIDVTPTPAPIEDQVVKEWADRETDVSKLSGKYNDMIKINPQLASYIMGNIRALQNGGMVESHSNVKNAL